MDSLIPNPFRNHRRTVQSSNSMDTNDWAIDIAPSQHARRASTRPTTVRSEACSVLQAPPPPPRAGRQRYLYAQMEHQICLLKMGLLMARTAVYRTPEQHPIATIRLESLFNTVASSLPPSHKLSSKSIDTRGLGMTPAPSQRAKLRHADGRRTDDTSLVDAFDVTARPPSPPHCSKHQELRIEKVSIMHLHDSPMHNAPDEHTTGDGSLVGLRSCPQDRPSSEARSGMQWAARRSKEPPALRQYTRMSLQYEQDKAKCDALCFALESSPRGGLQLAAWPLSITARTGWCCRERACSILQIRRELYNGSLKS